MKAIKFGENLLKDQPVTRGMIFDLMRGWVSIPTEKERGESFSRLLKVYPDICSAVDERFDTELHNLASFVEKNDPAEVQKEIEYRILQFHDWWRRCKAMEII